MRNYIQAYQDATRSGFVNERAIERHVQQQAAIDELLPNFASFFFVVEPHANKYHFLGQQQVNVSGYSNEEFLEGGIALFLERVHPDDAAIILNEIYPTFRQIVEDLPLKKKREVQIQYNYSFKHKNGTLLNLMEQGYILELDETRAPSLVLGNVIILNNTERLPVRFSCKIINESDISETIHSQSFNASSSKLDGITTRELDILRNLASGKTSREIADELFISKHTVDTHRRNLLKKLECKSVVELARIAFANGLL